MPGGGAGPAVEAAVTHHLIAAKKRIGEM